MDGGRSNEQINEKEVPPSSDQRPALPVPLGPGVGVACGVGRGFARGGGEIRLFIIVRISIYTQYGLYDLHPSASKVHATRLTLYRQP